MMTWQHTLLFLVVLYTGSTKLVQSECSPGPIGAHTAVTASTDTNTNPATGVFTDKGWCADKDKANEFIDVEFQNGFGVKSLTIGSTTVDQTSYPRAVTVQYVPTIGTDLQDFQPNKTLIIHLNGTGTSTVNLQKGVAMKKLRFTLENFAGRACMTLNITGCDMNKLCTPACQNGGHCMAENTCFCENGFHGATCETKPCTPEVLGLFDGRISQKDIVVSSEDPKYTKSQMGLNTKNPSLNTGWCAADSDPLPWVQIHFEEPKSINSFYFYYINEPSIMTYMETFDLRYIAPTDSAKLFRTYADNIESLNGTHGIKITLIPPVVTDYIQIISRTAAKKACFKLELEGCDPRGLCQSGWCLNGGSCVGEDICRCPKGFIGDRCDKSSNDINTSPIAFVNISQDRLFTNGFTFEVTGSVKIQEINKKNIVSINGTNSFIKIDKDTVGAACLNNLAACQNGFTFSLDVNFGSLVDKTYIVSSGGDLPNHTGLALFYQNQALTYVVSTNNLKWQLTVKYIPVINQWQKFEITWNKNLGIGLFLDGKLLSTHTKPQPTTTTVNTQLCIGCSPGQTSTVFINMQILQVQLWSVSRTELVNAGIVKAPVVTTLRPMETTTQASTTKQVTTATKSTTALTKLCTPACQNGGHCMAENTCFCENGFHGATCETKPCTPEVLGLFDGRISQKDIVVSSEDPQYTKSQMGLNTKNPSLNTGWCAADNDPLPWVQIHFEEPKSISSFYFYYINEPSIRTTYMESFDLRYIAPTDSAQLFRTYADNIESLNGTHAIKTTLIPPVVTDYIQIISRSAEKKACFKLELEGCDPRGLCQPGWCMNGGSCVGEDICRCPKGFIGDRCDKSSNDINTSPIAFVNITQDRLFTNSITFEVMGSVKIQEINKTNILIINGTNSFIKIDKNTVGAACLNNLAACQNGFTFSLNVNFGSLVDKTYIVSSGGDLPDHTGLALYYQNQALTYVVSTNNLKWQLTVKYIPVINQWQKFEITWNKNLGIGLFLDGKLLSTHTKPQPTTTTMVNTQLCIGCSPGEMSTVFINMQILQVQLWSVSRTELVNAGIVKAPVVTTLRPMQTTTQASTTKQVTTATKSTSASTTTVVTTKQTTPNTGYLFYNMTITGIVGNLLITPAFNFTVHGNPKLELENNSQTALVLNCTQHQYVELLNTGIPCLQDLDNCDKGFTFNLEVKFTQIDIQQKTYILSSGGDEAAFNGMALYLHSNLLTYGVKKGTHHWAASTNVQNIIKLNKWYQFGISWSEQKGLLVLIDGFQVIKESQWTPSPGAPQTNPVLIGKSPNNNYTSCMKVRNLYTWTAEREVLVTAGILPGPRPLAITMTTQTGQQDLTPYDVTFLRIDSNSKIVYTTSFLLQGHGDLSLPPQGGSVITLVGSMNQYMTLLNRSIVCIDIIDSCRLGFAIEISVQVFQTQQNGTMYFFSSINDNHTGGVYMYYENVGENGHLHYGFKYEKLVWSDSVKYNLGLSWHSFIVSWSHDDGIILFENFKLISQSQTSSQLTVNLPTIGDFKIGRGDGPQNLMSVFQVNNVKIWPCSMGFLIQHTIFTTQKTTTIPITSTMTTATATPVPFTYLKIVGQVGNIITTTAFNLTIHGPVTFVPNASGDNVIQIDGGYLEINESSSPCLSDIQKCGNGVTVTLDFSFSQMDNSVKFNLFSIPPTPTRFGISLYYQSSYITVEVIQVEERRTWYLTVPLSIGNNIWNSLELKWSVKNGVFLYINGNLIGSESVHTTTSQTAISNSTSITIGTTSMSSTNIKLKVKGIGIGPAPSNTSIYTQTTSGQQSSLTVKQTTVKPSTMSSSTQVTSLISTLLSTITVQSNPPSTTVRTTEKDHATTALPTFSTGTTIINQFAYLNITGNIIYTEQFIFTSSGNIQLVKTENGQNILQITTSNDSYIEVDTTNLTCFHSNTNCKDGLTVAVNVSLTGIQQHKTVYIISNSMKESEGVKFYLYYVNSTMFFGCKLGSMIWSADFKYSLSLNSWHNVQLSFTKKHGVAIFIDNKLIKFVSEQTSTRYFPDNIVQGLTIGRAVDTTTSSTILIGGFNVLQTVDYQYQAFLPEVISFSNETLNNSTNSVVKLHGTAEVVRISTKETAIKLNISSGAYIEVTSPVDCVDSVLSCSGGMTIEVAINFITFNTQHQLYLISHEGSNWKFYLYYQKKEFHFGLTFGMDVWETNVQYEVKLDTWNTFALTWSSAIGYGLYINNEMVSNATLNSAVNIQMGNSSLFIGKGNETSIAEILVNHLKIWSMSYDILLQYGLKSPNQHITSSQTLMTTTAKHSSDLVGHTSSLQDSTTLSTVVGQSTPMLTSHTPTQPKSTTITSGPTSDVSKTVHTVGESIVTPTKTPTISVLSTKVQTPFVPKVTTPAQTSANSNTILGTETTISGITTKIHTPTDSDTTSPGHTSFTETSSSTSSFTTLPPKVENFAYLNITGNILYTEQHTFIVHGNPTVVNNEAGDKFVQLNSSSGAYIQLDSKNLTCVNVQTPCNEGFTVGVNMNIIDIKQNQTFYMLANSANKSNTISFFAYYYNGKIHFGSTVANITLSTSVEYHLMTNTWHSIEISVSQVYGGVGLIIDGNLITYVTKANTTNQFPHIQTTGLTVGQTTQTDLTTTVLIGGVQYWSKVSHVLVQAISGPLGYTTAKSTPAPASTPKATTTVATTKPTTTTVTTTTQKPIPTFHWNLTLLPTGNIIIGQIFNLTIHGSPSNAGGGLDFKNTTQYIELGQIQCLLEPQKCAQGLTVQFSINFKVIRENTYFLVSGGQLPNGVGIAVIYRYGNYQFIVSTTTQSWYATCGKEVLTLNKFHVVMLSWHVTIGLEIIVDNKQVDMVTVPVSHEASATISNVVYFGKQPAMTVKYEYILQTMTVWYSHIDILVVANLCPKPERPEKTTPTAQTKPNTSKKPQTSPATKYVTTKPPQCPAGCISVTQTASKAPVTATSTHPTKPSTTKATTPTPTTTHPTTPTTTERGAPNYHTTPIITATVDPVDQKAYLACAFERTSGNSTEMTVALLIDNNRVLVQTVLGNAGIAMFAVSQVNMNLYKKEIKCSLVANYVGSSHSTQVFFSRPYIPEVTIKPSEITVTEGHPGKHVTIHSTAPPQLYCCNGCKGQCQVHIVGTFIYNRKDTRCNKEYISQALIESTKPQNYDKDICGFALTNTNWKNDNNMLVMATLDNRRDGTQKRELKILVNVYNQPPTAQITERPVVHTLHPNVKVTIYDSYHSPYTCKSINDPHMLTFDGVHFNNMKEGQFVMFKHTELPFEVRSWYHKCSKRSHATCNCGVAVKSGDDVITVTGCHTISSGHHRQNHGLGLIFQQLFGSHGNNVEFAKTPMTIQIYKNGELTPGTYIRRYGCGQKYEIQLPTGMIITVQQSYKPFINIWIKASSSDRGKSTGLCGNYNGKKDEWSHGNRGIDAFIKQHVAPTDNFFNGVGASSLETGSMYCGCIENKGSVCRRGLGFMECATWRYDITRTLVSQAKAPILTANRQKRQATTPEVIPTVTPDGSNLTKDEAVDECKEQILNSTITNACEPILTTNLTQQIENCAEDYIATGSFEWAKSALTDIAVDCVENVNTILANNDTDEDGNTTIPDITIPDNLEEILSNTCVDDCGQNGQCQDGVCVCNEGYSGTDCNISRTTKPTVSSVPNLCDISNTQDCMGAIVFGDNFVNSTTLTCHFDYIEVTETVQNTQQSGTVPAEFISTNQVVCQLPRLQSASITISNDGQTPSERASPHVVFDSGCIDCVIQNESSTFNPYCTRIVNTCIIASQCYQSNATKQGDVCRICNPAVNETDWTTNLEKTECTAQPLSMTTSNKSEDDEKKIIALAVVSAVLAAMLILLIIYIVRSRSSSKSKAEFGEYEVTKEKKLHREETFPTTHNPLYSQETDKL